jgi:hypothetical protein
MQEQLDRIKFKIRQLRKLDYSLELFGANNHRYSLNATLDEVDIKNLESKNNIILPPGYANFLTTIGNGGAGPYYGLEPLKNVLFDDLDFKKPDSLLNPSKSFPHSEAWNMKFTPTVDEDENEEEYERQYEEFTRKYYAKEQLTGVIAISNFGCAVSLNLVVNGQEYGNVWTDDRASDAGIYPSMEFGNKTRINFLDWYELWLDKSITEINNKKQERSPCHVLKQDDLTKKLKPWWKFW